MIAVTQQTALLIMWITFSVLALAGVIAVFIWAVRTRQFANQQAARFLALKAGIPGDNNSKFTTESTENTERNISGSNNSLSAENAENEQNKIS